MSTGEAPASRALFALERLRAIDERELDNAMGIVEEAIRSSESG